MSYIYLASPYNHTDHEVRNARFEAVVRAAAIFLKQGHIVYSPIAEHHYMALHYNMPKTWEFWQKKDLQMLRHASALWVLRIDGWTESVGVSDEITFAISALIPIKWVEVPDAN